MELIQTRAELEENIARLHDYLQTPGPDHVFAVDLIRLGICFVGGQPFFVPSRFVGYCSTRDMLIGRTRTTTGA